MSVKVDLGELPEHMQRHDFAYLLTVNDDQRVHAVAVRPVLDGDAVAVAGLGRSTRANLEARPGVTLLWPPFQEGGYSLIVDGDGTLTADGAAVTPTHAVLHRPADDGGHDCVPVGDEQPA